MAAQSSRAEENAAVCAAILAAEDHYDVLQVPGGAKTDEIRRNYLRISVRVHPDRNQDPNATQAFQKVSEAYAVLSDEEARRRYDAEQFMSSASNAACSAAEPAQRDSPVLGLYRYEQPVAGSVKVSQVSLCEATFVGRSMERTTAAAPSSAILASVRWRLCTLWQCTGRICVPSTARRWLPSHGFRLVRSVADA